MLDYIVKGYSNSLQIFCKEVSQKKKRRFDWDSLQEYFSIQKKSDLNRWEIDNKLDSWTKWTLFDEYLEIGN
jgi:hypothetical protein